MLGTSHEQFGRGLALVWLLSRGTVITVKRGEWWEMGTKSVFTVTAVVLAPSTQSPPSLGEASFKGGKEES